MNDRQRLKKIWKILDVYWKKQPEIEQIRLIGMISKTKFQDGTDLSDCDKAIKKIFAVMHDDDEDLGLKYR
jgi:uncharacterized protein YihD (DUF1040 family)